MKRNCNNISIYAKAYNDKQIKQNLSKEISKNVTSILIGMSYDLPKKIAKGLNK